MEKLSPYGVRDRDDFSPGQAIPVNDEPLALVEKISGAVRIAASDPRALAMGVRRGLLLADALAHIPDLRIMDHTPLADRYWLERLADSVERYTPMVAIDPPDGITLDITGCAHLFGSEAELIAQVKGRLSPHLQLRHAMAGTPEAAQALARFRAQPTVKEDQAIKELPIAALRLDEETETALWRSGLKTIGDLAARPTAPLTARFGGDMTAALARVLGRTGSRIIPRRALPALSFERRFAEPIARIEDALRTIEKLARTAARVMEERGQGGRYFAVRLFRSDGQVRNLAVESSLPLRDPVAIMRLFGERLDTLADPLDPGFGFDLVQLAIPLLESLAPVQLHLEERADTDDALSALVDRLGTRFGRNRILRFAPRNTHIPEHSVRTMPATHLAPHVPWSMPMAGEPPLRPLHLFDPPLLIDVMAEVPDGPPLRFRWRHGLHDVLRSEGPERVAAEWWRRNPGSGLTRDYYRVEDQRGHRFWIFRHGLYERETIDPAWYIHGLFA